MRKVVLVVGHSEILQGAINENYRIDDQVASEFLFNKKLALRIMALNKKQKLNIIIEYRDNDYETLPGEINVHDADLVVSLHCNAFNTKVEGCETLYYKHTKISDKVAKIINTKLFEALENSNRGIKPREYNRALGIKERGAYLLKKVAAPCVICEPFFIDNDKELDNAFLKFDKLALAYLRGIEESLIEIS